MKLRLLIAALITTSLACRPVLTIGWTEILIIAALIIILLGPALYKLFRRYSDFQTWKNSKKKKPE